MKQWEIDSLCNSINSTGKESVTGLVETHISWVILTRKHAYKIKKPVKFSFLDFTTLKKRKHFCQIELKLNKRLAKSMYLAVVPIFKNDAIISFEPPGGIIDYAVVMKRMNITFQMDNLLQSGKVTFAMITSLAKKIAVFHHGAETISGKYDVASLRKRFNDMAGIKYTSGKSHNKVIEKAINYSDNFLNRFENIFLQREAEGFIRDVHGDLHAGNIFLYRDPLVFDCIEFNDDMRRIDVLDEVAFLCMDLESYGRKDLSSLFYKNYLKFSGFKTTASTELIFGYFKLYRANIRAKVAMIGAQSELKRSQYNRDNSAIDRYLNLMQAYLQH